jgi:hypothetical protein
VSATGSTQAQTGIDLRRAYRLVPVVAGVTGPGAVEVTPAGTAEIQEPGGVFTAATTAPNDAEWLIRLDEKNGSRCLSVRADATIGVGRCLPSDASMRLRLYRAGTDGQGRPAYVIGSGLSNLGLGNERFLTWDPAAGTGPAMADVPRAQAPTRWSFVDQGPSTLAR